MRSFGIIVVLAAAPALVAQSPDSSDKLDGRWQATVDVRDVEVPFQIEFQATSQNNGARIQGTLFNGDERFTSTSGQFAGGSLTLNWNYMAAKLQASFDGTALTGTFYRPSGVTYAFHATRAEKTPAPSNVPSIAGLWTLEGVRSEKGEKAWQFIVKQDGASVSAAILRIDGDTGTLTGTYKNGEFVLSHFSGMRPALVEVTAAANGTLDVILNKKQHLTALRPAEARSEGLAQPEDPSTHTGVKNASEPFRFSFPDLNGKMVSNDNPRFKGKVVLVNITGSWCPNCHDEAPFLAEVYKKYRARGLEIVGLDFEEADQLKNPTRLRAFLKRYGIEYTVLLAGDTDSAKEKLPQAVNWDAWPTTFFVGRDGRVRAVHTGFPSEASGELYVKAKEEFTAEVEKLLAENVLTLQ